MRRPESPLPPAGSLTTGLFRVRNQYSRWREKGAPGWLLIYTLGGRGRFGHAGGDLIVGEGDLVLLRPKIRHDYGLEPALGRWDLLWAYFFPRAEWLPLLRWPAGALGLLRLTLSDSAARAGIVRQLQETHRLNIRPHRLREALAMNALEKVLLLCDSVNPRSGGPVIDARVRHAMDYLCEHLAEPMTQSRLARACGLSVSRLAHLFRDQTGQTPRQFLEFQRLARARHLLAHTQESIGAIAADSGFPDLFHFSKRFKRHFAASPRRYRARLLASSG